MKRFNCLLAAAVVALGPAAAQAQQSEGAGWRVVPRVGTYWLDKVDGVQFHRRSGSIRQGALLGVSVDFDTPVSWLGFRLSADRTIEADARVVGGAAVDATTRGFSMEVRLQPVPRTWAVRPFAVLGSGGVHLEFEDAEGIDTGSQTHSALHYGFGVDVDFAGVPLRLEGLHRRYDTHESRERAAFANAHAVLTAGIRIDAR